MIWGFIISWAAPLTVNACCMMLTVNADTTSFETIITILAGLLTVNLWVIIAIIGMGIAITGFTFIGAVGSGWFPRQLVEAWATVIT